MDETPGTSPRAHIQATSAAAPGPSARNRDPVKPRSAILTLTTQGGPQTIKAAPAGPTTASPAISTRSRVAVPPAADVDGGADTARRDRHDSERSSAVARDGRAAVATWQPSFSWRLGGEDEVARDGRRYERRPAPTRGPWSPTHTPEMQRPLHSVQRSLSSSTPSAVTARYGFRRTAREKVGRRERNSARRCEPFLR